MKKITVLVLAVVLMAGTASGLTVDLIADGGDPSTAVVIGTVDVADDGTDLTVVFTTVDGWELVETHLGINDGIIVKGKGNVKVGQLSAAGEKTGRDFDPPVTTTTYTFALADLGVGPDGIVTIAAHASVRIWVDAGEDQILDTEDDTYREESAWGEGPEFAEDRNWAMYFEYTLLSDLIVSELEVLELTVDSITYGYTITNIGGGPANLDGPTDADFDNVSVQAMLSADDVFGDAGDIPAGGTILGTSPLGMLAPGGTFTGSFTAAYNGNVATHPYLTLMVDWGSVVAESDETNNTASAPLTVTAAP